MAGKEKTGREENKLKIERVGFFAAEILGGADTFDPLRYLRSRCCAGKRFAGEVAEGEILRADGYRRHDLREN